MRIEPKREKGSLFLILMIIIHSFIHSRFIHSFIHSWLETNSFYRNHSYQTVIKENMFDSTTLELGTKERWILEGRRWLYLMPEKLEFDFHFGKYKFVHLKLLPSHLSSLNNI